MEGGFGDWKQDHRLGRISQILSNINRDKKKHPAPFSISEFTMRPKKKELTKDKQKQIRQRLDAIAKPKKKGGKNGKKN